ncbi:hypothetical protein [Limisphaera sp. VF-2]|uniref:hypothetical protein n=1 Tax=Limisphaera sp. VF-2 TaxID=3400418 RepID=UPI003C152791
MPGVELGDDVIVGAGAVVTRSFPSGSVLVGVPARPLRRAEAQGQGKDSSARPANAEVGRSDSAGPRGST